MNGRSVTQVESGSDQYFVSGTVISDDATFTTSAKQENHWVTGNLAAASDSFLHAGTGGYWSPKSGSEYQR